MESKEEPSHVQESIDPPATAIVPSKTEILEMEKLVEKIDSDWNMQTVSDKDKLVFYTNNHIIIEYYLYNIYLICYHIFM